MHAQFIVLPPLTKIAEFFVKATGAPTFYAGTEWFKWKSVMPDDIELFRRYIRPSHQALINAAVAAPTDGVKLCAFLRQLLRPHQFKIEARGSTESWVLVFTGPPDPDVSGGEVIRKEGVLITWQ
jgi:hypothetical protein